MRPTDLHKSVINTTSLYLSLSLSLTLCISPSLPLTLSIQAFPIRERDDEESFYGRIQRGGYELTRPVWKKVGAMPPILPHPL